MAENNYKGSLKRKVNKLENRLHKFKDYREEVQRIYRDQIEEIRWRIETLNHYMDEGDPESEVEQYYNELNNKIIDLVNKMNQEQQSITENDSKIEENNETVEDKEVSTSEETPAEPVQEETPAEPVQEETPAEPVQEATATEPVQEEPTAESVQEDEKDIPLEDLLNQYMPILEELNRINGEIEEKRKAISDKKNELNEHMNSDVGRGLLVELHRQKEEEIKADISKLEDELSKLPKEYDTNLSKLPKADTKAFANLNFYISSLMGNYMLKKDEKDVQENIEKLKSEIPKLSDEIATAQHLIGMISAQLREGIILDKSADLLKQLGELSNTIAVNKEKISFLEEIAEAEKNRIFIDEHVDDYKKLVFFSDILAEVKKNEEPTRAEEAKKKAEEEKKKSEEAKKKAEEEKKKAEEVKKTKADDVSEKENNNKHRFASAVQGSSKIESFIKGLTDLNKFFSTFEEIDKQKMNEMLENLKDKLSKTKTGAFGKRFNYDTKMFEHKELPADIEKSLNEILENFNEFLYKIKDDKETDKSSEMDFGDEIKSSLKDAFTKKRNEEKDSKCIEFQNEITKLVMNYLGHPEEMSQEDEEKYNNYRVKYDELKEIEAMLIRNTDEKIKNQIEKNFEYILLAYSRNFTNGNLPEEPDPNDKNEISMKGLKFNLANILKIIDSIKDENVRSELTSKIQSVFLDTFKKRENSKKNETAEEIKQSSDEHEEITQLDDEDILSSDDEHKTDDKEDYFSVWDEEEEKTKSDSKVDELFFGDEEEESDFKEYKKKNYHGKYSTNKEEPLQAEMVDKEDEEPVDEKGKTRFNSGFRSFFVDDEEITPEDKEESEEETKKVEKTKNKKGFFREFKSIFVGDEDLEEVVDDKEHEKDTEEVEKTENKKGFFRDFKSIFVGEEEIEETKPEDYLADLVENSDELENYINERKKQSIILSTEHLPPLYKKLLEHQAKLKTVGKIEEVIKLLEEEKERSEKTPETKFGRTIKTFSRKFSEVVFSRKNIPLQMKLHQIYLRQSKGKEEKEYKNSDNIYDIKIEILRKEIERLLNGEIPNHDFVKKLLNKENAVARSQVKVLSDIDDTYTIGDKYFVQRNIYQAAKKFIENFKNETGLKSINAWFYPREYYPSSNGFSIIAGNASSTTDDRLKALKISDIEKEVDAWMLSCQNEKNKKMKINDSTRTDDDGIEY